jgi:hypothetical protein
MLRWVLLCDYCSLYYPLPKTSELGQAIIAHIIVAVYFRDHYRWFRVCSFAELSSAFIIPPPRALQLSTSTFQTFFSSELHYTSMGHARLVCTHLYIVTHLVEGRDLQVPFFSNRIALHGPILALPYNTILRKRNIDGFRLYVFLLTSSIRGHLLSLKFRPHVATRTPHRQNKKEVIHGTRLTPQHNKRVKTIQNGQKIPRRFTSSGGARMRVTTSYKARICAQGATVW